jgi:hypothetical protein
MIPTYKEEIHVISMGGELGPAYQKFEREITQRLAQALTQDDSSGQVPWFQALFMYPDMPWLGWTCKTRREGIVLGEAPALPKHLIYPLEEALIDYVRDQFFQRRPTIVFTENTGQDDDQERLKELFERNLYGPSGDSPGVTIMRASLATRRGGNRQA